jgi:hypothetical protein
LAETQLLNLVKDIGIGAATLLILGRVLFKLVQAAIEFFQGLREDNQARNSHFATLLAVNQAIAGQMELTRQAMERQQEGAAHQIEALRANTATLGTLQQAVVHDVEAVRLQIEEGVSLLHKDHDRITMQLADLSRTLVDNLAQQFDATKDTIAEIVEMALSPVQSQLDALCRELSEKTSRVALSGAVQKPNVDKALEAALESGSTEVAS